MAGDREQEKGGGDYPFSARPAGKKELEEGLRLAPRFNEDGVLPAIASDARSGEVLMLAWMNAEALRLSIETGIAHYWSRSRRKLWKKGEESGNIQKIIEIRTDCDQDAIWMKVEPQGIGAACHTGHKSCFYRSIPLGGTVSPEMKMNPPAQAPLFDPKKIYGGQK